LILYVGKQEKFGADATSRELIKVKPIAESVRNVKIVLKYRTTLHTQSLINEYGDDDDL
jgi:hypothetical protein